MKSKASAKRFLSAPAGIVLILGALAAATACSSENDVGDLQLGGAGGGSGAGQAGAGGTYVPVQPAVGNCPMVYATQSCTCDKDGTAVPGRQECGIDLNWSACQCAEIPETVPATQQGKVGGDNPLNHLQAAFDWQRTVPEGTCEAGYYEGLFDGMYNSQATALASFGFWTTVPVDGDVSATIQEKAGSNGEFFEIADGVFEGTAMDMFPFVGDFEGELDCESKSFEGALKRCYYEIGMDRYGFEGIARSQYDVVNHAFINGVWSVTEPTSNSIIYSPLTPDAAPPTDYPAPLDVQPGQALPATYPVAYKGGTGNWSMTLSP
jgi:hypothetical protein